MSASTHPTEHYYSVLNLPAAASDNEVRERYRALSVVFHPDKQHDARTKDTASKTFLEIQKAYEVLSDPFLRAVYDVLGEEGLSIEWSENWRSRPIEQVRKDLKRVWIDLQQERIDSLARAKGTVSCGIDATTLFDDDPEYYSPKLYRRVIQRLSFVRINYLKTRYSFQKQVTDKTRLILATNFSRASDVQERKVFTIANVSGTIRHQFSPRLTLESKISPLQRIFDLAATYERDDGSIAVGTTLLLHRLSTFAPPLYPPVRVTITRLLSAKTPLHGVLKLSTGATPEFSMDIVSPSFFDWRPMPLLAEEPDSDGLKSVLNSGSPFALGTIYRSFGLSINGLTTHLRSEIGVNFEELALQLKTALQFGFTGLSGLVGGIWKPFTGSEAAVYVALGVDGVHLRLELLYMGQRLVLPILLSEEYDPELALWTTVVPSVAYALGYYFVLGPKRAEQRRQLIRQSRRAIQEDSDARREYEAMQSLLKDTANRHVQAERKRDGLIITEATYGVEEVEEEISGLGIDVTIPLQALVHNSQLYISSRGSKASLQGFYDPCPLLPKVLKIRYMFGGRMHYAEIPDAVPVAIPLQNHLVE